MLVLKTATAPALEVPGLLRALVGDAIFKSVNQKIGYSIPR